MAQALERHPDYRVLRRLKPRREFGHKRQGEIAKVLILDTETTGLSAEGGDRIIELGCVELYARKLTGNNLHFYLNPERDSHEDALRVHGITNEFLNITWIFE